MSRVNAYNPKSLSKGFHFKEFALQSKVPIKRYPFQGIRTQFKSKSPTAFLVVSGDVNSIIYTCPCYVSTLAIQESPRTGDWHGIRGLVGQVLDLNKHHSLQQQAISFESLHVSRLFSERRQTNFKKKHSVTIHLCSKGLDENGRGKRKAINKSIQVRSI